MIQTSTKVTEIMKGFHCFTKKEFVHTLKLKLPKMSIATFQPEEDLNVFSFATFLLHANIILFFFFFYIFMKDGISQQGCESFNLIRFCLFFIFCFA